MWTWNWAVFLMAVIPCVLLIMFSRGYMNTRNVENLGPRANYRLAIHTEPVAFWTGTLTAGVLWALIVTAIAGFFF